MAKNPHQNALTQLDEISKKINLDKDIKNIIALPQRVLTVNIPVRMDSGKIEMFEGYRVQHNNYRGPHKGGIRYFPKADLNEVKALAHWMSLKCATVGIPLGGGKGGITVDPKKLSEGELERLSRGYVRAIFNNIGPEIDVPAPDVYTTPQIMDWMTDEYRKIKSTKLKVKNLPKKAYLPCFTGKTIENGGSAGRGTATAQGGVYVLLEALKKLNMKKGTVAVQGFGNAGYFATQILYDLGFKVVAVSDSRKAIYCEDGFDPESVMKFKEKNGTVGCCECKHSGRGVCKCAEECKCFNLKSISQEALLELDVDVLVPAALENQITEKNANKIKAKVILELANGPVTPEADKILFRKKIMSIPDILANAGGVTVSYFEWLQNMNNEKWTEDQVFKKLATIMRKSFKDVYASSQKYKCDLRTGAGILAVKRIEEAIRKNI